MTLERSTQKKHVVSKIFTLLSSPTTNTNHVDAYGLSMAMKSIVTPLLCARQTISHHQIPTLSIATLMSSFKTAALFVNQSLRLQVNLVLKSDQTSKTVCWTLLYCATTLVWTLWRCLRALTARGVPWSSNLKIPTSTNLHLTTPRSLTVLSIDWAGWMPDQSSRLAFQPKRKQRSLRLPFCNQRTFSRPTNIGISTIRRAHLGTRYPFRGLRRGHSVAPPSR